MTGHSFGSTSVCLVTGGYLSDTVYLATLQLTATNKIVKSKKENNAVKMLFIRKILNLLSYKGEKQFNKSQFPFLHIFTDIHVLISKPVRGFSFLQGINKVKYK